MVKKSPKFVIAVRKDLKMPAAKLAVQVAHSVQYSLMSASYRLNFTSLGWSPIQPRNEAHKEWLVDDLSKKIVVGVDDEAALLTLVAEAEKAGIAVFPVHDVGLTFFNGKETLTCAGFGPDESDRLDEITGKLKPLRD